MSRDPAVQALLDKQAIAEVIARYSRTLDWLDDDGQASCYWPEAEIDYGFFTGAAADFVPVVMAIERRSQRRWHFLGSVAIALHSATTASAECYGLATGVRESGGEWTGNLYGGRYLDAFEKRGDEWRIARRQYVMDWSMPLGPQNDGTPDAAFPLPILSIIASGHPLYRPM
ncbi:MAG: nuclear transport factor 2 family protein [Novosphingobium sp.]